MRMQWLLLFYYTYTIKAGYISTRIFDVKVVNFILCIPCGFLSDWRFFVMYQLPFVNAAVVGRQDHYELRRNRDALLSTYAKNMVARMRMLGVYTFFDIKHLQIAWVANAVSSHGGRVRKRLHISASVEIFQNSAKKSSLIPVVQSFLRAWSQAHAKQRVVTVLPKHKQNVLWLLPTYSTVQTFSHWDYIPLKHV